MSLEQTKQKLIEELKSKNQTLSIFHALNFIKEHEEFFLEFGIGWYDFDHFAMNMKILTAKSGRYGNTVARNIRTHGFTCKRMNKEMKQFVCQKYNLQSLPDPNGWTIRSCPNFNQFSTENEIKSIKYIENRKRKRNIPQFISIFDNDNYFNSDFNSDFNSETSNFDIGLFSNDDWLF